MNRSTSIRSLALVLTLTLGASPWAATIARAAAATSDITVTVDLSDTTHHLIEVEETLAMAPGPLTLLFPQWIQGHHAPVGNIAAVSGLVVKDRGQVLDWHRDAHDPFAFHLTVPAGAERLEVTFDYLGGSDKHKGQTFSSARMVRLDWQWAVLYPAGRPAAQITAAASLVMREKWQAVSSLTVASAEASRVVYDPVDLETLLDSPAYAGRYVSRNIPQITAARSLSIDVLAETEQRRHIAPEQVEAFGRAFDQADRLFASQPYRHYDFLVTLSDHLSGQGVEHQLSSEDSLPVDYFSHPDASYTQRNLMVHEYVHAWNGKLHRPAGLVAPDFNTPLQGDLLWVYEGLTAYLDKVLTVRGGLWTPQTGREALAEFYADYDHESGRAWRTLQDTTVQPIIGEPPAWSDYTRDAADYYDEAVLLWLDVDTQIRTLSDDRRSLDDFIHAFFGSIDPTHRVVAYDFDDVVKALNAVQPYDWAGMLRARLDSRGGPEPKDGLTRGGYRLVYSDVQTDWIQRREARTKTLLLNYSVGFVVGHDAVVRTVRWGGPAFQAGLNVGDKVISVDGKPFSGGATLVNAIAQSRPPAQPILLKVSSSEGQKVLRVIYPGGLRYPRLEPIAGARRRLDDILAPR